MACSAVGEDVGNRTVGMGQIAVAPAPARLTAVLGSCVGVAIYHAGMKVGALGHVVLPDSRGRAAQPGKFADTAIPAMLAALGQQGVPARGLVAKITGGACMFGAGGPLQIGDANITAVLAALAAAGLPIALRDLGGSTGRRIVFNCSDGSVSVASVDRPPILI